MKLTKEQIKIINDMIEEAIEQGAEYSGTYCCFIKNFARILRLL